MAARENRGGEKLRLGARSITTEKRKEKRKEERARSGSLSASLPSAEKGIGGALLQRPQGAP